MDGALSGTKVLDVATLYPAPLLAAMLGDLGADVVKVEPPRGDPLRRVGALDGNESRAHRYANRNKRSIVVDTEREEGVELLVALTGVADVIVLNQTDEQLRAWRCTYDEIAARNAGAVVASLTAFGRTGPWAGRGGNGSIAEAFGGFAALNGPADGQPTLPSLALGDTLGAIVALNGVLAALCWRSSPEGRGRGQLVDASLAESVLGLLGSTFAAWDPSTAPPTRTGSRIPTATPRNVYRTADGHHIVVSAPTDAQVARVLTLIGLADDASTARFATASDRVGRNADALDAHVASWIGARPLDEVVAALDAARVPCAAVQHLDELIAHEQVQARNSIVALGHASSTRATLVPAPHPQLSATPGAIRHAGARDAGADTDGVLGDWLGGRA